VIELYHKMYPTTTKNVEENQYLWLIMIIANQKSTTTTSYIMPSSLSIKHMGIKV